MGSGSPVLVMVADPVAGPGVPAEAEVEIERLALVAEDEVVSESEEGS